MNALEWAALQSESFLLPALETCQQVIVISCSVVDACQPVSGIVALAGLCWLVVACRGILLENLWRLARPKYAFCKTAVASLSPSTPRVTYHERGPVGLYRTANREEPPAYCIHYNRRVIHEYEYPVQVWICAHDVGVRKEPIQTKMAFPTWRCKAPHLPHYRQKLADMDKIWIVVQPDTIPSNLQPLTACNDTSHVVGRVPNLQHDLRIHSVVRYRHVIHNQVGLARLIVPAADFARAYHDHRETLSTHLHAALYDVMDSDIVRFIVLPFLISDFT